MARTGFETDHAQTTVGCKELIALVVALVGLMFWWPALRSNAFLWYVEQTVPGLDTTALYLIASFLFLLSACLGTARWMSRRGQLWAMPTIGFIATVTCIACTHIPSLLVCSIRTVSFAAYTIFAPILWAVTLCEYIHYPLRKVLLVLLGSFVLSYIPAQLLGQLGVLWGVYSVVGPSVSCLCLLLCQRLHGVFPKDELRVPQKCSGNMVLPGLPTVSPRVPLVSCLVIICLVCSIPSGFIVAFDGNASMTDSFLTLNVLFLIFATLLLLIAYVVKDPYTAMIVVVVVSVLCFFVGNIAIVVAGFESTTLQRSVLAPCSSCYLTLLYCIVVCQLNDQRIIQEKNEVACDSTVAGALVFSTVWVVCSLLRAVFRVQYASVIEGRDGVLLSLLFGTALAVCVIMFLVATIRNLMDSRLGLSGGALFDRDLMAAEILAIKYGLTDRERQMLSMVLEGNTFKRIAEMEGLSLGTIQGRAKLIYRKLDVHSKQELTDLAAKVVADKLKCDA